MSFISKSGSVITVFLLEILIYAILLISYFFLVLHFLGGWINKIFETNRVYYAVLALVLIVVQGVVLERLTTIVMKLIKYFMAIFSIISQLARPHETIIRPTKAPNLLIYRFAGPLLAINADYFAGRVQKLIGADNSIKFFLVNAEAIIDIDKSALEILSQVHNSLKSQGIEFGLYNVKGNLRQALDSLPSDQQGIETYPSVSVVIEKLTKDAS